MVMVALMANRCGFAGSSAGAGEVRRELESDVAHLQGVLEKESQSTADLQAQVYAARRQGEQEVSIVCDPTSRLACLIKRKIIPIWKSVAKTVETWKQIY